MKSQASKKETPSDEQTVDFYEIVSLFIDAFNDLSDEKILQLVRGWRHLHLNLRSFVIDQIWIEIDELRLHDDVKTKEEALETLNNWIDNKSWNI